MARTGPQKYPGATRGVHWYQDTYGGSAMESNVGVIHTTEGRSVPSYGGGASAPNFTALPDFGGKRLRWFQHFDFDTSSRALVNRGGGVETNTLNAVQIELVGTCDPRYRTSWGSARAGRDYLFWPDAPDWALRELARFVRWAHDNHGLRMQSTVTWKAYPGSYGDNGVRLSGAQWQRYYGYLGHQHVPENSHGDPGDLDMARVLEHARGTATQEDDMPSAEEICKAVWRTDDVYGIPARWRTSNPDNAQWYPQNALNFVGDRVLDVRDDVKALAKQLEAQATTIDKLVDAVGQAGSFDPEQLRREIREAIESITVRLDVPEGA